MYIKLYVRTGDPYSDMVRNLLKYHQIDCEIIEVSRSIEHQKKLHELVGHTNTPVLHIGDKVYSGFDREKIKEILGIKNPKSEVSSESESNQ